MLSILDVKKKLPQDFVTELYEQYTPLTVDKILSGMLGNRYTTLRVNTIMCNIRDLMSYLKQNNIYDKGYIYLQSLSSMIPPIVLNPKPGEKVLDLTAAPGSKTTQMASMMNNEGYILANELDKIRCERLQYNVKKQGANIVEVINNRGEKVGEEYQVKFDKVLLDAPCSGEGRFLGNNVGTYRNWSKRTVRELAKLQKKLFKSAYTALKPNGMMVYSTCTLNKDENENILQWAIENFNVKLLDINIDFKEKMQGFNDGLDGSINKAIRILPSKNMEGFFVAKLKKK